MKKFVVWATVVSFVATPILSMAQTYKALGNPDSVKFELPPAASTLLYAQNTGSSSAAEGDCLDAKKAGKQEGSRDTNGYAWVMMGLGLTFTGIIIAAVSDPGHPKEEALAKSTNRNCFDEGYRGKKKSGRIMASVIGTLIASGLCVVYMSLTGQV
jgi:hypothetical protein